MILPSLLLPICNHHSLQISQKKGLSSILIPTNLPTIIFISHLQYFISFFLLFFFIFEREREHVQVGEGQREKEGQRIRSEVCAHSRDPDVGLKPTKHEITTWAKVRRLTHRATQVPLTSFLIGALAPAMPSPYNPCFPQSPWPSPWQREAALWFIRKLKPIRWQ